MPRTQGQLEEAAARAERLLDELDPRVLLDPATRVDDLREVGVALKEVAAAERHLAEAVAASRGNGRSWGEIGSVLGISKQGARDRFGGADKQAPADGPTSTTVRVAAGDPCFVVPKPAVVELAPEPSGSGARRGRGARRLPGRVGRQRQARVPGSPSAVLSQPRLRAREGSLRRRRSRSRGWGNPRAGRLQVANSSQSL